MSASSPTCGPLPWVTTRRARELATQRGWTVKPDGPKWRRVVPSPEPHEIIQLGAIKGLVEAGFLVVCVGGGGVPVVAVPGGHEGVEAVIDKDLASSLLAVGLDADMLVLATDVDAVYLGFGTPDERAIRRASPERLRAESYPEGSMGPKVDAVCRFVEATGNRGVIGSLEDLDAIIDGTAGTEVSTDGPDWELRE